MSVLVRTSNIVSDVSVGNGTFSFQAISAIDNGDDFLLILDMASRPTVERTLNLGLMESRLYDYMVHFSKSRRSGGNPGDCFTFAVYLATGITPIIPALNTIKHDGLSGRLRWRTELGATYVHLINVPSSDDTYEIVHAMVGLGGKQVIAKWGMGDNEIGIGTIKDSMRCYGGLVYKVNNLHFA
ncbi:MAG: hypothetical protein PVI21_05455 [Candidatus Woesebacteria bacterium]